MLDVLGLPDGAEYRIAGGLIPGSQVRMEFIEFRNAGPKTPFSLRVPDPGRRASRSASPTSKSCCRA